MELVFYVDCIIKYAIVKPFFASYVLCKNFADDLKKTFDYVKVAEDLKHLCFFL